MISSVYMDAPNGRLQNTMWFELQYKENFKMKKRKMEFRKKYVSGKEKNSEEGEEKIWKIEKRKKESKKEKGF